ncbi:MAG: hypothetical protein KDK70_29720 [Myxococcales bacterium]|nr:hypothetical protein [Myxococcales bacterium]
MPLPPRRGWLSRRVMVGAGAAAVLTLGITCALLSGGDEAPGDGPSGGASAWLGRWLGSGPDPEALEAIDDAIVAHRLERAESDLATLEQEHPEDPRLLWRRGRLQVARKQPAQALSTYGAAVEREPGLLEEPAFFADLSALLHDDELRTEAVDVAVEQLGHPGHEFLLERLGDLDDPLPWAQRKRAAAAVGAHPECAARLDARRQLALDLLQAADADDPCGTFGRSLLAMQATLDEVYLQPAHDAKLPRGCKVHKQRLAELRAALVEKYGPPQRRKGSGRCRGFRGLLRGGC